jgi:hypothetical protein
MEKLKQIAQEMFAEAPTFKPDHFEDAKDDVSSTVPPAEADPEDDADKP